MVIVCWNMQGTGYPSAEMFAELVSGWGADVVIMSAFDVSVQIKGELYPDAADPRMLAVLKIRKGDEVRRVAACHAPFGGGAYVSYVRNAVKELARFSETPRGGKRHVHPVDIWLGDLNTAGAHADFDCLPVPQLTCVCQAAA